MGPNYRKLTMSCPEVEDSTFCPGQCIVLHGRYYAVAAARRCEVDIVVPASKNPIDLSRPAGVKFPTGNAFVDLDCNDAYFVAAGSGIAAAVSFATHRKNMGRSTFVQVTGRNVRRKDVIEAFPCLAGTPLVCWDTAEWGRPLPHEMVTSAAVQTGSTVFFAGPRGMLESLRKEFPDVRHNY